MNETIKTIMNHRSVRKFTDEKLTTEQIHTIVRAAQQASTSSYVMAYTIIGVTDEDKKEKLFAISGQPYVKNNGHLFIFCADLQRNYQLTDKSTTVINGLQSTEQFIVATVDASLAAQNASIAAESLGLGICYLGSLRNDINQTNDILELPDYVIPLFGLAVGYPAKQTEKKPRLPIDVIYHENKYNTNEAKQKELIHSFDEHITDYYKGRSENKRMDTWSNQIRNKYSTNIRMDVNQFVKNKKMNTH
ncbi:oxygen-insensitive NADPH nitroreductase [Virgibacillus sp. W0430]|uniref:oxygen-insensitive NADPH nitroreductase n=1 Tax=Virgibacillus sp. W0430 TaxID=3391580 RepID=UPI003F48F68C